MERALDLRAFIGWRKIEIFVYDVVNRIKVVKDQELPVRPGGDMKYMLDANLSSFCCKAGQSDIYVYKIDKTVQQVTNDVYDTDASFVLAGKTELLQVTDLMPQQRAALIRYQPHTSISSWWIAGISRSLSKFRNSPI
jgi:hypothetical protein